MWRGVSGPLDAGESSGGSPYSAQQDRIYSTLGRSGHCRHYPQTHM